MKTTQKELQSMLDQIAVLSGLASSREQAEEIGVDKYLFLEYASSYGGYRVVNVGIKNGAHYGAFGGNGCESRISAKEMYQKLDGIIIGLELSTHGMKQQFS